MPRLIEIIGSPGSGKTFICSELEKLKKNDEQIFFHSSNYKNFIKYKNLNPFYKILIKFKVIFIIIIFCLIFSKRLFLKKVYKRNFFFRVIFLFYRHLVSIELLKKALPDDKYLILEPGPIMYFLQDYFYVDEHISESEIKIFNKIFLNTNYIIHSNCNFELLIKRLNLRDRGLPARMRGLNNNEIKSTIKKSTAVLDDYIIKSNNLDAKIININTSNSAQDIKYKILNILN